MSKDDIKQVFKEGNGLAIAEACKRYFQEQIKAGKYKVIEYYKPLKENINGENVIDVAQQIFAT